MKENKRDRVDIYVFVMLGCLLIFGLYDQIIDYESIQDLNNRSKSTMIKTILYGVSSLSESSLWWYWSFRVFFLLIALWMGYKIIKVFIPKK